MKKIISSILAASFIFATCAMNVMAADPTARDLTVSATPATDLEVGNDVTVEVALSDNTELFSAQYQIQFDPEVFELDETEDEDTELPAYIDATWGANIEKKKQVWTKYLGTASTAGTKIANGLIMYTWLGNTDTGLGIPADSASTNFTLGKFTFKVKSIPTTGTSEIKFTKYSTSTFGSNTEDPLTLNNATVKFKTKDPDPEVNEWNITIAEEEAKDNNKLWKITPEKTGTVEDISKFDITFKAADTSIEPLKKSLRTEVLNKIADSWNTGYNFYIGLKVKTEGITGVTADWDIAAGSSTVNVNK